MTKYKITTPEQVHFHYEIAGLASRSMAWMVDQVFLWILRFGIVIAFGIGGSMFSLAFIILGIFLADFGYYIVFENFWAGQSPGKKIYRIRVISARGGKLKFPDIVIRNLLRPLDTLPFMMTLGGVVAFLDPLRRRIGDLAAETIVIRDRQIDLPAFMLDRQIRVNSFETDSNIKNRILARVTREERDLIIDLMMRRDQLEEGVREDIFKQAAQYFRKQYNLPEDLEYLSDEQTVLNIALVVLGAAFT